MIELLRGKRACLFDMDGTLIDSESIWQEAIRHALEEKGVPKDEIYRIVHIVLAHHGQLDFGSPVVPCTQEAVIVHYLDELSAKVDIIENTGNGEKNFALGTTVVKDS